MNRKEWIIKYYNECTREYQLAWANKHNLAMHYGFWDSGVKKHSESLLRMNQFLAEKAGIKAGERVLDAGCGIGGSSIWLAENLGAIVTGINISQKQIDMAKRFARERGVENLVKFYNRDFIDTKFPNKSFDVVWEIESMCHADDKRDFLKETWRILKKGGRLIVADGFQKKEIFSKDEQRVMNEWLSGWAVPNLPKIRDFENYLKSLKFRKIEFLDITQNVMPTSRRIYRLSVFGLPLWRLLKSLGLRTETQVNNLVAGIRQHRILKDGLGAYGVFYAEK
ncbi:MAG: methyltransferase domain-containing protein [Candidatus Aenigmatarchaeota archaeon]|nr:MAG: methyltransferase domain-containing protein [Candidatus Aenigmarchaeota archaeon]